MRQRPGPLRKVKQSDYAGLFEEVWGPVTRLRQGRGRRVRADRPLRGCLRDEAPRSTPSARSSTCSGIMPQPPARMSPRSNAVPAAGVVAWAVAAWAAAWDAPAAAPTPTAGRPSATWGLTDTELQGLAVFNDPNRANCASCHSLEPGPAGPSAVHRLRLRQPRHSEEPGQSLLHDAGRLESRRRELGGLRPGRLPEERRVSAEVYEPEMGKFKVPTLRNVDLRPSEDFVKAYGHNGYFKSLEDIVFFYHWRAAMDAGMCGGGGGGMGGGMGVRRHGRHVPAAGSGPEPRHFEYVPSSAGGQYRGVPEDAFRRLF